MSFELSLTDATQSPSFPGENVQVSPTFVQTVGGSETVALFETQPSSARSAVAIETKAKRGCAWRRAERSIGAL